LRKIIAFIVTELGPGGAETQVFRIATELSKRGHKVRVISLMKPVGYVIPLESVGVEVKSLNLQRGQASYQTLLETVEILEEARPDVLFAFLFHANLLGSVAGALAGVPKVVTSIRGLDFGGTTREFIERIMLRLNLSKQLVTNSQVLAASFLERGIARPEELMVIPNGIDIDVFTSPDRPRHAVRDDLQLSSADFVWICVANVLPIKDFPTLLAAFQRVSQDSVLIIAGALWDTKLKTSLEADIARLGLAGRVTFLGGRTDIVDLLHASDAFVMSSISEGTPNAMIEAMAVGLPVVSTRAGGVVDLIEEGRTGFMVDVADSSSLARVMVHVMEMGSEARAKIGEAAREFVHKRHQLSRVVDQWESLI